MQEAATSNWAERNWRWLIAVGCLTVIASVAAFVFGVMTLVFRLMESSDVYRQALARARQDPALVAALGVPIEDGYFKSGNLNETTDGSGAATMTIPLSGPNGKATLRLDARESHGAWHFSRLGAEVEATHQQIDLLRNAR